LARVPVELSSRARRDIRQLSPDDRRRVRHAVLETLAQDPLPTNTNDRQVARRPPWRRLRVGHLRVLYRPRSGKRGGRFVARVVHRRNLDRAIETLEVRR
jgi:mRNA-degrading endonuclease RelE of RelBE toxin-antitoxin system